MSCQHFIEPMREGRGARARMAREIRGLSRGELAGHCGLQVREVTMIEHNRLWPVGMTRHRFLMRLGFPEKFYDQEGPLPMSGARVWICGPGVDQIPVCSCGVEAEYLCDAPLSDGATCDSPICHGCATEIGDDLHLCRYHLKERNGSP